MQRRWLRFAATSRASSTRSEAWRSPPSVATNSRCPRGASPRSARIFSIPASISSLRASRPSSVLGGKNSNEKTGSPRSAANWNRSEMRTLRAFLPGSQVTLLRGREAVDADSHRVQLESGDLAIDLRRDWIHGRSERSRMLDQVLRRQRLVGEAHVHDARGVSLRGGEIDQAAFAEQGDAAAVGELVLVEESADGPPLAVLLQPLDVDLDVEVAAVRDDGAILHAREVLAREDAGVAGHRAEEVADRGGLERGHDAVAVHRGFQRLERVHLGDDHVGAHAFRARGQPAAAPAVSEDHEDLPGA